MKFRFFVCLLLLGGYINTAVAQATVDGELQRQRAQRALAAQRARQRAPHIRLQTQKILPRRPFALPAETPCFTIHRLQLRGQRFAAFGWIPGYLQHYAGQCIGRRGVNRILKGVLHRLIAQGYLTTRVGVPPQNLSHGVLTLTLIPGLIHRIRFADRTPAGSWQSAFPARPGDLLNLRDLEQGLEQMKRVPSQDVRIKILPAGAPGESDIVLTVKRRKPWRATVSLDDAGVSATGRLQGALTLAVDNPLGINDLFSLGVNSGVQGGGQRGSRGDSLNYSAPWGYWTFALSGSVYHFHQTIKGANQDFVYSGDTANGEVDIQRVLSRGQTGKTSLQWRLLKQYSKNYIADTEILTQRHDTTAVEIGLVRRQYLGPAQLDLTLAHREGVPWFGGQADAAGRVPDSPTYRYRLQLISAALTVPFTLGRQPLRWRSSYRQQITTDPLYAADFFSIGNRWTVRGFSGDQTLAAERGWYWRNELDAPLGRSGQTAYVGLDHGEVGGPSRAALSGSRLTGAVLGLRGGGRGIAYTLFVGWPLQKPSGFDAGATTGFQLSAQY